MAGKITYNSAVNQWEYTEIPLQELVEMFLDFIFKFHLAEEGQTEIETLVLGNNYQMATIWREIGHKNNIVLSAKDQGNIMNFLFINGQIKLTGFSEFGDIKFIVLRHPPSY
jgi:hypothetical protein